MPRRPAWFNLRTLPGDEAGAAAIYIGATAALILGAAGLAIDLGRYMTLHTELQQAADAAALVGAAELDRQPGAQARAQSAITSAAFGSNRQSFATDGAGDPVLPTRIRFLSALPADGDPVTPYVTNDDAEARFVEVTVGPRAVDNALIGFVGGADRLATAAIAVAGNSPAACFIPPLMVCNPFEKEGGESFPDDEAVRGVAVRMKFVGPGAAWGPGAFGLLDSGDGSQSTKDLQTNIGSTQPVGCYGSHVGVRPGQSSQPIRNALNTRFDIYENTMKAARNDWAYRPARNVTKGRVKKGNDCNAAPDDPATVMAMPPDDCFFTGACDRFGDGEWDREGYWSVNHPGLMFPSELQGASRYAVYNYEIDRNLIPNNQAGGGENGNPQCSAHSSEVADDTIDRRVLMVALVNCLEGIKNSDALRVEAFLKVFVIRPAQQEKLTPSDPDADAQLKSDFFALWGEILGRLKSGEDDEIRTTVQLYR